MTDIDKRIDEIMEMDRARTQGKWVAGAKKAINELLMFIRLIMGK